jgi:hypothetical protein
MSILRLISPECLSADEEQTTEDLVPSSPPPLEIQRSPPKPLQQILGRRMREGEVRGRRRRRKPLPLNLFLD